MPQNLFKISDGRNYFWQWDTNQKLYVLDPTVDEVHFSNRDMTHAIPKDVCIDKDGKRVCYIPDVLLTLPKNLVASAYVTDDNATKTLRSIKFAVRQRPIPADYITNDDLQFEDFTERLDIIEDIIEDSCLVQRFGTMEDAELWAQESQDAGAIISVNTGTEWKTYVVEDDYSITSISCNEDAMIRDIESLRQLVGDSTVLEQIEQYITNLDLPNKYDAKGSATQALSDAKQYAVESSNSVQLNLNEEIARAKKEETALVVTIQQVNDRATKIQSEVDAIEEFVGELPNGSNAKTIVEYVNAKTESVASDEAISELGARIEEIDQKIGSKLDDLSFVSYNAQELTDEQKAQARENIGAGTQSDWNVNDEDDVAYIKNKPFYDSRENVELFNGQATSIYSATLPTRTYNIDHKYIVIFDGTEYELSFQKTTKPTQLADGEYYYLGSPAYFNGTPYVTNDEEYPFCVTTFSDSLENVKLMIITKAQQRFPVDVQVIEKSGELKQIDAKYLPNGATTQVDWSISDENASGHVKNRTHYVVDRELLTSFVMSVANANSYSVDDADSSDVIRSYINDGNSIVDIFIDGVLYQCQAIFTNGHYYMNLDGSTNTEQGLRIYIGGSKPNMIYLHPESFGLDMSADTRMVEIYTPEVLKQLDHKYIKDMYYETEPVETVLVDNLTSDTSDDNWPSCNFITGDKYKVIWNSVAYDCVCHNYDGWKVLGTPDNYPFYIDDDGGDALYVSGANEEDTWTVSIIHVKQEIHQIAPKYIKDMYYEEENILTSGTINEPGFLNDSYNLTALTSSFIEGAEYVVRINGIERTVVCKFDDDGSGNQFLYLGAYPSLITEESWFSVALHVASNNLMAYVHDRITCPVTIEVLQRPIHPINTKYLPIIGHGVGTVFEGTCCNGEYRDEKYKMLLGEHTLVIDGVATTINFIDAVGGSYASCDFGDIETWDGAICIALQDDDFHDIKIIGPRQVIKKEYLPEISSEQSDWEQNDESHSSYIKNRPFYAEIQTIFDNLDVTGNLTVPYLLENVLTLKEGASYRVDGVFSYNRRDERINVKFNGIYKCINAEISIFPYEASGEPVLIVRSDHIYLGLGNKYDNVSVTFYTLDEVTKYHKIDANYLPDNLATTEYVDSKNIQPDWNQMDPAAADYVKNRTHWDESFILDVSNSDKAYDFDSGFGFLRVSTNPDDFPDDIDGLIIEYDDNIYSNVTCDNWPAYNATVHSIKINDAEYSITVTVRQENTNISVYKNGTRYSMTNPGIGVWVIYDPGVGSRATARVYTNNVHPLEERYIPDTIARVSEVDSKMNKSDPVGTGSLSMNRKPGSNEGVSSTTLGHNGSASGVYALAEGAFASAAGYASHAEGYYTNATRHSQHVEGQYNILDTEGTTKGKYVHIVGNGTALDKRSNAHTLDWDGLGWFAGGVKVGGTGQDDAEAKELATQEYVVKQILAMLAARKPKIATVELKADAWVGESNLYSQVVEIEGVTPYSQVDLTPSVEQLVIFYEKDLSFVTENEDGIVTVYAIGQKPKNDYTIQVTITEVSV